MSSIRLLIILAWRNLWRNIRRTLVILFAIILGVWAMVVMAAFMRGMSIQILNDSINNLTGHIQIHAPGYLDDPVVDNSMLIDIDKILNSSMKDLIVSSSGRIRVPAVIASERESMGIVLLGIEPAAEAQLSFIGNSLVTGRYLSDVNDRGILIGKKMAQRLETDLGKKVVLMSENTSNQISDQGFRIVGIYDTTLEATETTFVFIGQKAAQNFLGMETGLSEVVIRLADIKMVDSYTSKLTAILPDFDVKPWYEIDTMTKVIVEMYEASGIIWHLIVFIAMGFGIVNTLLMSVFERTREFGLFLALGLKPKFILGQVWFEAVFLLFLGVTFGNLFSWLTVLFLGEGIDVSAFARGMEMFNMQKIIPLIIQLDDLFVANSVVIILGLLTGLYPAWRASRLVPADALTRI